MIPAPDTVTKSFGAAVVGIVLPALDALFECDTAVPRLLNPTDANGSVGVTLSEWLPLEAGIGQYEPLISSYIFQIEALTKNSNGGDGELAHYSLAQSIRNLLNRDTDLRAALSGLVIHDGDSLERTYQWLVAAQRFANNLIRGEFTFISVTTLTFTTEIAC